MQVRVKFMRINNSRRACVMLLIIALMISMLMPQTAFGADLTGKKVDGLTNIYNMGDTPEITAGAAIVIDAKTGQVLYEKNCHQQKYPASTTKIMTALLTLENLKMEDMVEIDAESAKTDGNTINLKEGEVISVADLLYALILHSANDTAVALAKAVSGDVSTFSILMNDRAKKCGARHTNFHNPNGLPDEQHMTTAYDLAMITKEALKNDTFRKLITKKRYTIEATNLSESREVKNGNRMLWDKKTDTYQDMDDNYIAPYYEGATGVKTGYTNAAGSCLVASVERDGHELIGVVLGSSREKHYGDMHRILDYSFDNYDAFTLCKSDEYQYEVKVKKSKTKRINAGLADDVYIILPAGAEPEGIRTEVELEKKYEAPVVEGQAIGKVNIYYDDTLIGSESIVSEDTALRKPAPNVKKMTLAILKLAGIIIVILVILYLIVAGIVNRIYNAKRKHKRRKEMKEREKLYGKGYNPYEADNGRGRRRRRR